MLCVYSCCGKQAELGSCYCHEHRDMVEGGL